MIANNSIKTDESFDELISNDDDDIVIPETQDVCSQESVEELNGSNSIIDCDKTEEVSFDSKDTITILNAIKRRPSMNQSQPNVSVVSISSDEAGDASTVGQIDEDNIVSDTNDLFNPNDDEKKYVEVKEEKQPVVAVPENGKFCLCQNFSKNDFF